jgi:hypothetical protein
MTTEPRPELAFLLHADDDRNAGRSIPGFTTNLILRAELVHLTSDGDLRNILDSDNLGLASLQVRGQANLDDTAQGRSYGWSYAYEQPYSVDLRRARAMATTLGRLQTRLEKLTARYGHPESFGAYVLRVAEVLGVRRFVVWDTNPRTGKPSANGPRELPATAAVDWYATHLHDFHQSVTTDTTKETAS